MEELLIMQIEFEGTVSHEEAKEIVNDIVNNNGDLKVAKHVFEDYGLHGLHIYKKSIEFECKILSQVN